LDGRNFNITNTTRHPFKIEASKLIEDKSWNLKVKRIGVYDYREGFSQHLKELISSNQVAKVY
jgi:hypothetical protein